MHAIYGSNYAMQTPVIFSFYLIGGGGGIPK